MLWPLVRAFFFFFNDTATTEIYTLSLHDALPISRGSGWVVDGAAIKPRESGFAEQSGFGSDPPAAARWVQPEGLSDSSRWSQRSVDHRTTIENHSTP